MAWKWSTRNYDMYNTSLGVAADKHKTMGRQTDRQTDGQTDRQTAGQTDRKVWDGLTSMIPCGSCTIHALSHGLESSTRLGRLGKGQVWDTWETEKTGTVGERTSFRTLLKRSPTCIRTQCISKWLTGNYAMETWSPTNGECSTRNCGLRKSLARNDNTQTWLTSNDTMERW